MSRPRKEVDKDYGDNALMYGHKQRMIRNLQDDIKKLEFQCVEHLAKLIDLNVEGMKLPPEVTPVSSSPPPEGSL